MAADPWVQQAIDTFFESRKSPTQQQCDQIARSISHAAVVRPVNTPGSLSYTVICTDRLQRLPDVIVSFREPASGLDDALVKQAIQIHGDLVPQAIYNGMVSSADPPLTTYVMPYLPGTSCLSALSCDIEMDEDEETKHVCYIQHLARYFARSWSNPQFVDDKIRSESETAIHRRLTNLRRSSSLTFVLPESKITELECSLSTLFSKEYPQVLTHGDLSLTNILIDADTYKITGLVDWSLAAILPFGMELDCLLLMTGYMDRSGWHDYACRPRLIEAFWDEFWTRTGVGEQRETIRAAAETAAKIGAVLRYAFRRNGDGSPSEIVLEPGRVSKCLKAWFAAESQLAES